MRISELAERTGVPVATLKYYLRERLLPPGAALSRTRAEYTEEHVDRVRLVRAMVDTAGLSIAEVRAVVDALDHPPTEPAELFRAAAQALPTPHRDHPVSRDVGSLVDELGWDLPDDIPALHWLSAAVEAAASGGVPVTADTLRTYADACERMARSEVPHLAGRSPADAAALVVTGTLLTEPVVLALRRVAQAHVARLAANSAGGARGGGAQDARGAPPPDNADGPHRAGGGHRP